MCLPRFRFSVRGMMAAVAVVGMLTGLYILGQRAALCLNRSVIHELRASGLEQRLAGGPAADRLEPIRSQLGHHRRMQAKYDRAARRPWLPVAPDPPEPK
jgi:hypothetical protein